LPPRDWRFRIRNILDAAGRIGSYTADLTRDEFSADSMLQEAVSYNLIIIGEAAAALPEDIISRHPDIPWPLMRGMRNVLAHRYYAAEAEVIWQTASQDLPPLVEALGDIIDSESD
jgi:uncharacterized protein with HEPN domain